MDRLLTTHVGSIIRPPSLRSDLMAIARREPFDRPTFEANLRSAVRDVVKMQAAVGIDIVNDGEFSKMSWLTCLYNRVTGIEPRTITFDAAEVVKLLPPKLGEHLPRLPSDVDPGIVGEYRLSRELYRFATFLATDYSTGGDGVGWHCVGPIEYDATEINHHLAVLREAMDAVDVSRGFVTSAAPASVYYIVDEYFGDEEEFVFAIADALRQEYQAIIAAGFDLQIDDPVMWHKYSTIQISGGTRQEYRAWADLRINALNYALEGIPRERVRYHICSGSSHSAKVFDPSLSDILPFVMRANWGQLLFEQGNVGHEHEWTVWEDTPLDDDRILVPGVVTHHTQMLEHPELIAHRLTRLADIVGRERIIAGTDCGFAQSSEIERSDPWTQWVKFQALANGAALASQRLWR